MNLQKEEGVCWGSIYVCGNKYKGAHHENCANRDKCPLYKVFEKMKYHYDVNDYIGECSPRWWRRCTLYQSEQ